MLLFFRELTHGVQGCEMEPKTINPYTREIRTLMYHRIVEHGESSEGTAPYLNAGLFRRHLKLLDRMGYTAITLRDHKLICEGELYAPSKPIIITFDDGYLDTYQVAFPILQEFGMRAVVFVVGDRTITTNTWENASNTPQMPLMGEQHLLELHDAGFEIGSHTMTHAYLNKLTPEEAWEEISRSRMVLEIMLNSPVLSFAYPFGVITPAIKKLVQNAGYEFACATSSGPRRLDQDYYEIRRIVIANDNGLFNFFMKVLGPYVPYRWVVSETQRFLGKSTS